MTKGSKNWPTEGLKRRVASDDLVVDIDGEEYHIHKGEYVVFTRKISMADYRLFLRMQGLRGRADDPDDYEASAELDELFGQVCERRAAVVLEWTWHGPDGKPYPEPTAGVIEDLMNEEFWWLLANYTGPAEVPKNLSAESSDS
jgi:hypothetical protein